MHVLLLILALGATPQSHVEVQSYHCTSVSLESISPEAVLEGLTEVKHQHGFVVYQRERWIALSDVDHNYLISINAILDGPLFDVVFFSRTGDRASLAVLDSFIEALSELLPEPAPTCVSVGRRAGTAQFER